MCFNKSTQDMYVANYNYPISIGVNNCTLYSIMTHAIG